VRVLLVNSHGVDTSVGGAESYVRQLARDLPRLGYDVYLLRAFPGLEPDGVPVGTLHQASWRDDELLRVRNHVRDAVAPATRRLEQAVRAARPDVVHTCNLPGISTGIWGVCGRLGIPVVHTIQDYQLLCPRVTRLRPNCEPCRPHPLLCGLRNRSLARWVGAVSHVIGVSRHVLVRHERLFAATPSSLVRYPWSPPPEREFAPPEGPLRTLGYIGALDSHKGIGELLRAAPALAARGVQLRLAGRGPLETEVARAGAEHVGFVAGAEKEAFLRSCDAGILPSIWEEPGGPPWAVLDWLSAGRPTFVSSRGGLGEAAELTPGVFAVEPTAPAIEATVERLLDEEEWRRTVAAVRPVETEQSEERWLEEHRRIYEAAVARG
jgi:glycosyltransferase involved in cell wall biosynthesis